MNKYHKIQTVYFRDPATNFKTLLEGTWSKPEFEYLKDLDWVGTEKIDGTNIRIMWDGEQVRFGGKTDNAQIPAHLIAILQDKFHNEDMLEVFGAEGGVCLYGEGYGAKIQKGGNYIKDGCDFILFDVRIGDVWLKYEDVIDIANQMNVVDVVPVICMGKLEDCIEIVREGFTSVMSENKEYIAEGLILKPYVDLFDRKGDRIITKIKHKDFIL
jgi:hypothetical protein